MKTIKFFAVALLEAIIESRQARARKYAAWY